MMKALSEKVTVLNLAELIDNVSTDKSTVAEVKIKVDPMNEVSDIERSFIVREFKTAESVFLKMKKFD